MLREKSVALLFALALAAGTGLQARGRTNLLYIINNDPSTGANAVLGYTRIADGSLVDLPGSPFYTGGTGKSNPAERIGPDDSDGELIVSPDHRFLFATNTGSDNISVFQIRLDGSLRLVPGSPFPSGGKQPVSLALANGFLYVVNRGDGFLPTQVQPTPVAATPGGTNYSVLQLGQNGALTLLPENSVNVPAGASPSQVVASPDGQFVFGDNFLSPSSADAPPFAGIFPTEGSRSLLIGFTTDEDDGSMESSAAAALPRGAPFVSSSGASLPFLLGMRPHPTQNLLYVDAAAAGQFVVFSWDETGQLAYQTAVSAQGAGVGCWTAIDPQAKFAYVSAINGDQISVFSLTPDPKNPTFVQNVALGGPKAKLPAGTPEPVQFTTAPFNLSVAPDGKFLYVVTHETCMSQTIDPACAQGNAIHTLQINSDGTLTETPSSPLIFPASMVPNETHPKGIVVL